MTVNIRTRAGRRIWRFGEGFIWGVFMWDVGCGMYDVRFTIWTWNLALGILVLVFGTWYLGLGIWCLEFGVYELLFSIYYFGLLNLKSGPWIFPALTPKTQPPTPFYLITTFQLRTKPSETTVTTYTPETRGISMRWRVLPERRVFISCCPAILLTITW